MRDYYHTYPTCPVCHEPHLSGCSVAMSGRKLSCEVCHSLSNHLIDLTASGKFSESIKFALKNSQGKLDLDTLTRLPLIWRIQHNGIEQAYLEWMQSNRTGKYLITWPWKEVRFIPTLVAEVLNSRKDSRIVVIAATGGRQARQTLGHLAGSTDREYGSPEADLGFENIISMPAGMSTSYVTLSNPDIKKEMKKLDRTEMLEKRKVVWYEIRRRGTKQRRTGVTVGTVPKCKRLILEELSRDTEGDPRRWFEFKFVKRYQYFPSDEWDHLGYNNEWLWNYVFNYGVARRVSATVPYAVVDDRSGLVRNLDDTRLLFLSSNSQEIQLQEMIAFLSKIKPSLVVFTDMDRVMGECYFSTEKKEMIERYLKHTEATVLMFSCDPSMRRLFGFGSSGRWMNSLGIVPHTWDCEAIIRQVSDSLKQTQPQHPSPITSDWSEVLTTVDMPKTEYLEVDSVNQVESVIERVLAILDQQIAQSLRPFFKDLCSSPLFGIGDPTDKRVFSKDDLHYGYVASVLSERLEGTSALTDLRNTIERDHALGGDGRLNPILDEMLRLATDILKDPLAHITIVTRGREASGTETIIHESGVSDDVLARVDICSWTNLRRREVDLPDKSRHIIISPFWPSVGFSMHHSNAEKYLFVGGTNALDRTREIVKYRINEEMARPLWIIDDSEDGPDLLKSTCRMIAEEDHLTNERIEELSVDATVELGGIGTVPQTMTDAVGSTTVLKPGSVAALLLDDNGEGMFVPSSRTLLVKLGDKLEEIELEHARSTTALKDAVLDKEVLVNSQGLYVSIRPVFLKLMMKNGNGVTFNAGAFQWKGFDKLYNDVTYWNRVLWEAVNEISAKEGMSLEEASRRLADRLSKLGLTARDPEYMTTWWMDYDEVIIDENTLGRIYSVEHPKGSADIRIMFDNLKNLLPQLKLDEVDAERTYTAAVKVQNMRRAVFRHESATFRYLRPLFSKMVEEIKSIVTQSPTFRVSTAYLVRLKSEVSALKRLSRTELQELADAATFTYE